MASHCHRLKRDDGNVELDFRVPLNVAAGKRLVTVDVVNTALTADCFMETTDSPHPLALTPEYAVGVPGKPHQRMSLDLLYHIQRSS